MFSAKEKQASYDCIKSINVAQLRGGDGQAMPYVDKKLHNDLRTAVGSGTEQLGDLAPWRNDYG